MPRIPKVKLFVLLVLLTLMVAAALPGAASAGTTGWSYVGRPGFSNSPVNTGGPPSLTSDSLYVWQNTPYLAYQDNTGAVSVDVYGQANGWQPLGGSLPNPPANHSSVSLFVDGSTGIPTPYLAYQDGNDAVWVDVYSQANGWEPVGGASVGTGIPYTSISLSMYQGTPYVAYQDTTGVTVSMYDSGGWTQLGSPGDLPFNYPSSSISLSVDQGTPYVAYQDSDLVVVVYSYNSSNSSWQQVGGGLFNDQGPTGVSLSMAGDTPYVAYQYNLGLDPPGITPHAVEVEVYDQAAGWQPVGPSPGIGTAGSSLSLFVDGDTPYLAYQDGNGAVWADVYAQTNGWAPVSGASVGSASSTPGSGSTISLFVDPETPYVAYVDSNASDRASVATIPYTVSVSASPPAEGTVSLPGGGTSESYIAGTPVTVTATPAAGYQFVNWTEDGSPVGTDPSYAFTVESDLTLVANFNATTVITNNGGGPSTPPAPSPRAPSTATPPLFNLPAGAILDRSIGAVFAGQSGLTVDGTTYQTGAPPEIIIPIATQPPGPDYTIEIYHWQPRPLPGTGFPGRWVALATTWQNGRAVAVNDGDYTGWFAAWWVIKPHFTDIAGSWAVNDIRRLNGLGMVEGYPGNGLDRPFGPDRPITRTELTVIAARIMGLNPGTHAYAYLQPLSYNQAVAILGKAYADWQTIPVWARTYVAAMTKAGYVHGMNGRFDGDLFMSRIQAGVLVSNILRAVGYTTPARLGRFADAGSIPAWADGRLVKGVLNGTNGLLRPNDTITRAEESAVLLRLFRALGW